MARTRRQHRIGLILFVIVAAAACLALGYWQWSRYSSAAGTGQNLGYALQWPLFAAFFVYAYRRYVRLEAEQQELDEAAADTDGDAVAGVDVDQAEQSTDARPAAPAGRAKAAGTPVTEIPAHLLPQRAAATAAAEKDPALAEYNSYLAQLRAQDEEDARR